MRDDRVHLTAARIIGYAGIGEAEFLAAATKLPNYDKWKYEQAVRDLTRWDLREAKPPRYELHPAARKCVRVLLGPPPEDPEYASYWAKEVHQPGMAEPHVPGNKPKAPAARAAKTPKKAPAPKERKKPPVKKPARKAGRKG